MNNQIRKISLAGLFIALSVILARFLAGDMIIGGLSVLRISFGPIPIYLSGILLGPVHGAIVGALSDGLGYIIKPLGPYFPGFALNGALTGLIPPLLFRTFKGRQSWLGLALIVIMVEALTSMILTPLWLSIMTGKAFIAFLPSNIISRAFLIPAYIITLRLGLKYSRRMIPSLM
ncbi:MAG: folate family ECF transporter S component [Clostridiales bacterium]|nr:folate family ECF transporter S component [Clostridiales bacterium]